jgi:hypothetical protein
MIVMKSTAQKMKPSLSKILKFLEIKHKTSKSVKSDILPKAVTGNERF